MQTHVIRIVTDGRRKGFYLHSTESDDCSMSALPFECDLCSHVETIWVGKKGGAVHIPATFDLFLSLLKT